MELDEDVTEVFLDDRSIKSISLEPLSSCHELRRLSLSENKISEIDLGPLENSTHLQEINLSKNRLGALDLSPFNSHDSLRRIDVSENQLAHVDFSPLRNCSGLYHINLLRNALELIDLSPLEDCTALKDILLSFNQLEAIDLTPICNHPEIHYLSLAENRLSTIDPGEECTWPNLMFIDLKNNELEQISLGPFTRAKKMIGVYLGGNSLREVDLSPLSDCTALMQLHLYGNAIQEIDLEPLRSCRKLRRLLLSSNSITSLDLEPLDACDGLDAIEVSKNTIRQLDVTSLFWQYSWVDIQKSLQASILTSWLPISPRVGEIRYRRPNPTHSWHFLHRVACEFGKGRSVQYDILRGLGLQDYGFPDANLFHVLSSIDSATPTNEARELVREQVVQLICKDADEGKGVVGMKLEELLVKHGEIAVRSQKILDIRKKEIEGVQLGRRGGRENVSELWLTSYGYEILEALEVGLTASTSEFDSILSALMKLDIVPRAGTEADAGSKLSYKTRNAIWWFAMNRHRRWNEIGIVMS
jgi:Leucine-rich repeat (LRR) protein